MTDTNPLLSAFETSAGVADAPSADAPAPSDSQPQSDAGYQDSSPFDFFLDQTAPAAPEATEADAESGEHEDAAGGDEESDYVSDFPETIQGTPDAQAKWGELRRELKEARARAAQFEAEYEDTSTPTLAAAELERQVKAYEAQISDYERELAISRIEATREYKALVEEPLTAIVNSAEKLAAAYNVNPADLVNALSEVDPKRQSQMLDEIVDGMSERDRARIYRMADDTASLYETDANIRARASEALSEVEAQQQAEVEYYQQQRAAEEFEAATRVWDMVTERLPDIGVDYSALQNDVFASNFEEATPEARGYAASASVVLPHLVNAIAQKDARIQELERALGGLRKASPNSPAGNSTQTQVRSTNPIAGMLFGD